MTGAPAMAILINPFVVEPGREAAFLALWDRTNAIFREAPGYVSARLCRALGDQPPGLEAPFTHVNVAQWESAEHYAAALRDPRIKRLAADYREVSSFDPALYEVLREV